MKRQIHASAEADKEYIHKCLQKYNSSYMKESEDFSCHIKEDGVIVAGIVAESTEDTVEVEFLYVDKSCRGRGLGQELLAHVEDAARRVGMRRILLNTYSFQAPEFYRKMGYREILKLDPCFGNFSQFYFIKQLN